MKRYIILRTQQPIQKYNFGGFLGNLGSRILTGGLFGGLFHKKQDNPLDQQQPTNINVSCTTPTEGGKKVVTTSQNLADTESIQNTVGSEAPLTKKVPKAEGGLKAKRLIPKKQYGGIGSAITALGNVVAPSSASLAPMQMLNQGMQAMPGPNMFQRTAGNFMKSFYERKEAYNPQTSAMGAAAIGQGAQMVAQVGDMIGQNVIEKHKKEHTDGFGLGTVDVKARTKAGATHGAMSGLGQGAALGASLGSVIPGIGTVIGGAVGAIAGLFGGLFAGRKKAKKEALEAREKYEKDYAEAHAGAVRNQDLAAAKALSSLPQQSTQGQFSSMPGQFAPNGQTMMMPMTGRGLYTPRLQARQLQTSTPIFKKGGKLATPGATNIITKGKLHKENNNLGNKDKGVPVVSADGKKEYEVEKEEFILRADATKAVEQLVKEYNATGNENLLIKLGELMSEELLTNTQDNSGKYKLVVKDES